MAKKYFITGIGTGIGKTVVSAILTEKLEADYWKPIQSGDLNTSDTINVKSMVSNNRSIFHPETFRLTQPFSPHKSAALDGVKINLQDFKLPDTVNPLIIEGAGGLMVPLNDDDLMADLIKVLDAEVILVSQNYLGSINHTLLSWKLLDQMGLSVKGIIFNGVADGESERYILQYTGLKLLGKIPALPALNKQTIKNSGSCINL